MPGGSDAALNIPVVVVHGARPGKVLSVVAGSHGTEYASIIALEKLIGVLDPATISGTVIIVPIINIASFEQKVPHINPVDGKSMNRIYPRAESRQSRRRPDTQERSSPRTSTVHRGEYVAQGMTVGYVTDFFGQRIQESKAPEAGVVLFINAIPTMTKGGNIASIGVVAKQPDPAIVRP